MKGTGAGMREMLARVGIVQYGYKSCPFIESGSAPQVLSFH